MDIETKLGNGILKKCLENGWELMSEYDKNMFDKGIDYDSYTIIKNKDELIFEWSNWEEWEVSGNKKTIDWFIKEFNLSSNKLE